MSRTKAKALASAVRKLRSAERPFGLDQDDRHILLEALEPGPGKLWVREGLDLLDKADAA